jgi:hypothetical protein
VAQAASEGPAEPELGIGPVVAQALEIVPAAELELGIVPAAELELGIVPAVAELAPVPVALELAIVPAAVPEQAALVRAAVPLRTKSVIAPHHRGLVPLLGAEDLAAEVETTREPAAAEAVIAWEVAE